MATVSKRVFRQRPLPWPCSALSSRHRGDLRTMAALTEVTVTMFVRDAILAHMACVHRRLYADLSATPWDQAPEPCDLARRAAESSDDG